MKGAMAHRTILLKRSTKGSWPRGRRNSRVRRTKHIAWLVIFLLLPLTLHAQTAPAGQAAAPFDMSGYWTSVITQSWRLRMVVPPKGDYMGIPMLPAAKQVADAWDPNKPVPADELCKGYGAAIIMNMRSEERRVGKECRS